MDYVLPPTFNYDKELVKSLSRVYPGRELSRFLAAVRLPGSFLSVRVNTLIADPGEVLDRLRERGLQARGHSVLDEVILFPVEGPNKVPEADKRVVADKRASESVYQGAHLYAPGIVDADRDIVPGDEVSIVNPMGEVVAYGIARMKGEDMVRETRGLAVEVLESRFKAPKIRELPEYKEGIIYEQSIPSIIVGREVEPQPGEVIVDMCAAPGGKATHIVQLSKGKAIVYAFDHSLSRLERMRREVIRLKMTPHLRIYRADSRYLDVDYPSIKADKVVLDPPCSSLGVRPKLYDSKRYSDIRALVSYQKQFFKVAWRVLKPGGLLVYSTCTVTFEENEDMIGYAAGEVGFKIGDLKFTNLGSDPLDYTLKGGAVRFHPHIHDLPGYFIAKLVKVQG